MSRVCLALTIALLAGAHGKTYKVTYTTGSHVEADSTAPMYLQLSGYMGSTPYLKLGDVPRTVQQRGCRQHMTIVSKPVLTQDLRQQTSALWRLTRPVDHIRYAQASTVSLAHGASRLDCRW